MPDGFWLVLLQRNTFIVFLSRTRMQEVVAHRGQILFFTLHSIRVNVKIVCKTNIKLLKLTFANYVHILLVTLINRNTDNAWGLLP